MGLRDGDPARVGAFTLVDRLGSGGMGTVYLGRSASGRLVAVKLVHVQLADDWEFRARFRREVTAARRVNGAFTVPLVDADPDAERPWMATEYVEGPSLANLVAAGGPLRGAQLRRMLIGLADALHDIHTAGVVHRDLKPDNILMTEDGPRVVDFGISRAAGHETLTVTGRLIGTPPFMSPEQIKSPRRVTTASDVFSFGAVLVYAATGRGPFDDAGPYLTAYRVANEPPEVAELSGVVREIAHWCLAKVPAERPRLDELLEALRAIPDEEAPEGSAEPAGNGTAPPFPAEVPAPRHRTPVHRRLRLLTLLGVGITIGTLGSSFILLSHPPSRLTNRVEAAQPSDQYAVRGGLQPWSARLPADSERCAYDAAAIYCGSPARHLVKVDIATGQTLWGIEDASPGSIDPSPNDGPLVVRDDVVYALRSRHTSKEPQADLTAFRAGSGRQLWSKALARPGRAVLFQDGIVALSGPGRQVSMFDSLTGRLRWTYAWPKGMWCDQVTEGRTPHLVCPSADQKDTILIRLDPHDGTGVTITTLPGWNHYLRDVGRLMVFADYGGTALHTVDRHSGEVRRHPLTAGPVLSSAHSGGTLYLGHAGGHFSAVSPESGKTLWTRRFERAGEPAWKLDPPAILPSTRRVLLLDSSGEIRQLDVADGGEQSHYYDRLTKGSTKMPDQARLMLFEIDEFLIGRSGDHLVLQ